MIPDMEEASRLLTVKETCTYLRISPPTLYRMIERRELIPVKIGKRTLFDRSDLDKFIDAAKGPAPRAKKVPPKKPRAKRKSKSLPDRLF
jgi:excisionase family DNA binding protein